MFKNLLKLAIFLSLVGVVNASKNTPGIDYTDARDFLAYTKIVLGAFRGTLEGAVIEQVEISEEAFAAIETLMIEKLTNDISLLNKILNTQISDTLELRLASDQFEKLCKISDDFPELEDISETDNTNSKEEITHAFAALPKKAEFQLSRENNHTWLRSTVVSDNKTLEISIAILSARPTAETDEFSPPEFSSTVIQRGEGDSPDVTMLKAYPGAIFATVSQDCEEEETRSDLNEGAIERKEQPKSQNNN